MRWFWVVFCCCLLVSVPVLAQDEGEFGRKSDTGMNAALATKATRAYQDILQEMYANPPPRDYHMLRLRSYYPNTRQYTAFADALIDQMIKLSFTVKNTQNLEERLAAQREYTKLLQDHMANLEVLMMARSLSAEDVRFGDPGFLEAASESLIRGLTQQSDGLSPEAAIRVVTFGEEDILLRRLGKGKLVDTKFYDYGNVFLNVHRFRDAKGKEMKLFFDITAPIRAANAQQEEQKKKVRRRF